MLALKQQHLIGGWQKLPQRIVAFAPDMKQYHYRLRVDRFGGIHVDAQSDMIPFKPGEKCIVCVDPQFLFRRKTILQTQNRDELQRLAADFFPFQDVDVRYAFMPAVTKGENAYVYALPANAPSEWQNALPAPAVAYIPSHHDRESVQTAIQQRLDHGAIADLLKPAKRLLQPAVTRFAFLSILLLALVIGAWQVWQWQAGSQRQQLAAQIDQLSLKTTPIQRRYHSLQQMRDTLIHLQNFEQDSGNAMMQTLVKLITALPPGSSIDRIDYKDGKLNISGLGKNPQGWLQDFGVKPSDIQITPLPQYDRYVAAIPVVSASVSP